MSEGRTILIDLSVAGSYEDVSVRGADAWWMTAFDTASWGGAEITVQKSVGGVTQDYPPGRTLSASSIYAFDEFADSIQTVRLTVATASSTAGTHGRIAFYSSGPRETERTLFANRLQAGGSLDLDIDLSAAGNCTYVSTAGVSQWSVAAMDNAEWGSAVVKVSRATGGVAVDYPASKTLTSTDGTAEDLDASADEGIVFTVTTAGSGFGRVAISGSAATKKNGGVAAGQQWMVSDVVTAAYQASWGEIVRLDASGGAFTVTLPDATDREGYTLVIKETAGSTATVTVDGNGSQTIDGGSSISMNIARQALEFVSDGQNVMVK